MNRKELLEMRANLVEQKEDHWRLLNEAIGGINVVDFLLKQMDEEDESKLHGQESAEAKLINPEEKAQGHA